MYASFLRISRALHLDVFDQPGREKGSAPYFLFYLRTVDLLTIKGRGFISLLPFILQTAHPTFCGDIAVDTQLPPTYTRLISKRVLSAPGKAWRIQLVEKLIRKSGRF